MELTSKNVHNTFMSCLFKDDENKEVYVEVHGVINHVGFHPERIKENKNNICNMLMQLPGEFLQQSGGGYTFLNACTDKEGNLWTGEQRVVDELVCLGLAIEKLSFCLPREVWAILPGEVPYFVVNL